MAGESCRVMVGHDMLRSVEAGFGRQGRSRRVTLSCGMSSSVC